MMENLNQYLSFGELKKSIKHIWGSNTTSYFYDAIWFSINAYLYRREFNNIQECVEKDLIIQNEKY